MSRLFQINETTWIDPAEVATVTAQTDLGVGPSGGTHRLIITLRPGNHFSTFTLEYPTEAHVKAAARCFVAVCNKDQSDGDDDEIDS